MKRILYTFALILFFGCSQWSFGQIQLGQTITGTDTLSKGQMVALSADGQRKIISNWGEDYSNPLPIYTGFAEVYDWDGTSWNQVGNTIEGSVLTSYHFGNTVDISDDGGRILVAARNEFFVFDWDGTTWNQVGDNPIIKHGFGSSEIEMSGNGDYIVYGEASTSSANSEKVEVYELLANIWELKGSILTGIFPDYEYGSSVSINGDGNIIAVGSKYNPGVQEVFVFEWDGNDWAQMGAAITPDPILDTIAFGTFLDLSTSGNRIAIAGSFGATIYDYINGLWEQVGDHILPLNFLTEGGYFMNIKISGLGNTIAFGMIPGPGLQNLNKVYKLSDNNYWNQVGEDMLSENAEDGFYNQMDLSDDGVILIVSSNTSYSQKNSFGYIKVYELPAFCPWDTDENYTLRGLYANDNIGSEIAYSSNGKYLAVSTIFKDDNNTDKGQVKVYKDVGGTWEQRGITLIGESDEDLFGYAMDISNNGDVLAVSGIGNDRGADNAGHVRVFLWDGSNYLQHGLDIDGTEQDENLGYAVSLSNNGQFLAVGSPFYDGTGTNKGKVQVYKLQVSGITPFFNPIYGAKVGDLSGTTVVLSGNGKRLAIGSPNSSSNSGQVRVYTRMYNSWLQLGSAINGEANNDFSGESIALNSTGFIVAIGASNNDGGGNLSGHVRVFSYSSITKVWTQLGIDIDGRFADYRIGSAIDITSSGHRVAIGVPNYLSNFGYSTRTTAGKVQFFDWDGSAWVQHPIELIGENFEGYAGSSVEITGNGRKVAVGAPMSNKIVDEGGSVRIFKTCSSNTKTLNLEDGEEVFNLQGSISNEIVKSEWSLYPNPTKGELNWDLDSQNINIIEIYNIQGQRIFEMEIKTSTVNITELPYGAYFIQLISEKEVFQKRFIKN